MPRLLLTLLVFLLALTGGVASAITNNRTGIATGAAAPAASVSVNGSAAPREGPWWGQSNATAAGSSAAWLNFSIDATLGGTTDHADVSLLVPPSSVSPLYDADGNQTDDGLRTYTWDADSRLLSVTTKDTLLPAGAPMYRVTYQYDDGGRRLAQTTEARTTATGVYVLAARRCFLYDGWNCVAEYDYAPAAAGATRTLFRSQVWGASFAPGGAGGLLMVSRHTGPLTGTHCATHDGNGNVTVLINADTGTESARYDYDAFGNLLRATGPFAAENPYRFSTQYTDDVTGLLYYGYRYYAPAQGRWLSRDSMGEAGGINLYGFIGNDPVNDTDVLGMISAGEVTDQVWQFRGLLMQLKAQQEYIRKYVELYGDPRDPNFKMRLCEELQKYERLHAMLPGERERMNALMEELGKQEGERWDITRWAGFGESTCGPHKAYQEALAELAALTQEGLVSGDVLTAAIVGHAAVDAAFLEADMGEIDAQRAVGVTGVALNTAFMALAASGGMTAALGFLGTEAGVAGAKAFGARDGVAMAIGMASGLGAGGLANLTRAGGHAAANSADDLVTVYRGVNSTHAKYAQALEGVATPNKSWWQFWKRGSTPVEHNNVPGGTLNSPYTSWTTNPSVAENFAYRTSGNGVVLTTQVPRSALVPSPNLKRVSLIQGGGVVSESEVLLRGTIRATPTPVRIP